MDTTLGYKVAKIVERFPSPEESGQVGVISSIHIDGRISLGVAPTLSPQSKPLPCSPVLQPRLVRPTPVAFHVNPCLCRLQSQMGKQKAWKSG